MKKIIKGVVFTAEEHLRVQLQIERRAGELWCAGGCRQGAALNDWLQAEQEVLEQFIRVCAWRHSLPRCSTPRSSVGGKSIARNERNEKVSLAAVS